MNNFSTNIEKLKIRIANGDSKALDKLYRAYFSKLKLYGLQFAHKLNSYNIDDTIQELFIWIAKNYRTLNTVNNLEVYLFSALKQNIYQEISKKEKHKNRTNKYLQSIRTDTLESSVETKYIDLEDIANQNDYVISLLESLPSNQKEVIYLRNYVNMSYREIAQVMDLSEQVVRNYSYRALQKLRTKPSLKSHQSKSK